MASIGLALSQHPYTPVYLCSGGEMPNPAELSWPYPYFPQNLDKGEKLVVSGDIGGCELKLDFWGYQPFTVTFDNGETIQIDVEPDYIDEESCGGRFYTPLSIPIPEDAKSLTLSPNENLAFYEIGIEGNGVSSYLVPHDLLEANSRGGAELQWSAETGWTSETVIDGEFVYLEKMEPIQKLAQKYGVGFMTNECGSWASGAGIFSDGPDIAIKAAYDSEVLRTFQEKGISWCVCEMNTFSTCFGRLIGWSNTVTETKYYLFEDGSRRSLTYSTEAVDVYRNLAQQ